MSEQSAHEALAHFLHHIAAPRLPELAFVFHVANESAGGAKTKSGIPIDVLKEARMGARAGVWDWLYIGANQQRIGDLPAYYFAGVAIELKSTRAIRSITQGLTPEQVAWRTHYVRHGWYTAVYAERDWTKAAQLLVAWVGGDMRDFTFGG